MGRGVESRLPAAAGLALLASAGVFASAQEPHRGSAMFRADPAHTGVYPGTAGPALSGVKWIFRTGGPIRGSPVLAGGTVLFGSGDGNLYALEASSGRERWRADLGGAVHSVPAVSGDAVFVASRQRRVTALDLSTGRERWRFETEPDHPFAWEWDFWLSSPAVDSGIVYIGSGDGSLYALEASSGRKIWRHATGGRVRSSPAVADGAVYVGSMDGRLYALHAATGKSLWTFETQGVSIDSRKAGFDRISIVSSPAVSAVSVFVGSRDARLYAVDRKTGLERWRFGHRIEEMEGKPEVSWVLGSPALHGDLVFTGSSDGHFFNAVRAESGEEVWRFKTPDNVLSSGALAGGQVFFGCEDGHLFALDAKTGAERWRFRTGGAVISSPSVGPDGAIYVGSDDGVLYALSTGPEPAGTRRRRAVFWRDVGSQRWFQGDIAAKDYFLSEGYRLLDESALVPFFLELAEAARSVLVVAAD